MQDISQRKIAEDEAVYRIFFLGQQDLPSALQEITAYVLSLCTSAECGGGYIWQREGFILALSADGSHLEGKTKPGDCVEDEWFIVWLLCQISRRWPNAVVSVNDTDGEFLLIEAADVLPKWVTPTNAENRVWIRQGRLHLIPLQYKSAVPLSKQSAEEDEQDEGYLSEQDALQAIESAGEATLASAPIEASVFQRIAQYASKGCIRMLELMQYSQISRSSSQDAHSSHASLPFTRNRFCPSSKTTTRCTSSNDFL